MASKPTNEYQTFQTALKQVLRVSRAEMQEKLAAEKKAKATKPWPSARVSDDKD